MASKGEMKIAAILEANDISFEQEYVFPELKAGEKEADKHLRFDFAVFDDCGNIDFLIEFQGRQHYQPVAKYGGKVGFYRQRYCDNLKREFCKRHKLNLIEIPYTDENLINYDYIMVRAGY